MKNKFTALTVLLAACVLSTAAFAGPKFEEDLHYFSVIPEQPGADGQNVQVLEFFWYACPHCNSLEPHLDAWLAKRPDYVEFDRVPAMFKRDDVIMHAKTYYALRLMGEAERLHAPLFHEIHERNNPLKTQGAMETFLAKHDVDIDAYRMAMKSFAVQTQARRAAVLAERFDVRGVPAMVIDGKYRVGGLEGGPMMEVTDYLIGKVRAEKGASN